MKKLVMILGVIFLGQTKVFAAQGNDWEIVSHNYRNYSLLSYNSTELVSNPKAQRSYGIRENTRLHTPPFGKRIGTTNARFRRENEGNPDQRGKDGPR